MIKVLILIIKRYKEEEEEGTKILEATSFLEFIWARNCSKQFSCINPFSLHIDAMK